MVRAAKPAHAKSEHTSAVGSQVRRRKGSSAGELEQRLAKALAQQTAVSEILRVISQSPTNVQPVFDTIVAAALKLCRASSANVFTFDGKLIHLAAFVNVNPEYVAGLRQLWPRPPSRDTAVTRADPDTKRCRDPGRARRS
jgi:hypothetical protein